MQYPVKFVYIVINAIQIHIRWQKNVPQMGHHNHYGNNAFFHALLELVYYGLWTSKIKP